MQHQCHARGCKKPIPESLLMCHHHWQMVPQELKEKIYDTYRKGQERSKTPTPEYLKVAHAAVQAVSRREAINQR